MPINPANIELRRRLKNVVAHLENAIEDSAEDFDGALSHAGIALDQLNTVVQAGRLSQRMTKDGTS